jgi:hypothetical protein
MRVAVAILQQAWLSAIASGCQRLRLACARTAISVTTAVVTATLANGETVHRACHLNRNKGLTEEQCNAFKQARLVTLDETSMVSENLLVSLERTPSDLQQNFDEGSPHGGFHVTFGGDFCQLAPVGQDTVFNDECLQRWNVFIDRHMELKGMFRFKEDPKWGNCLSRFCQ